MDGKTLGQLPAFFTIGTPEKFALLKALKSPLSGYLGGIRKGGYWVERLQREWAQTFMVNHAVACNSATSGLLAACMAVGIQRGDIVWTSNYTMSATAACAKILGANVFFFDIETIRFSLNMNLFSLYNGRYPKAIIVTNLFGHPAYLSALRSWCDQNKVFLIEDNAQSPFAMENKRYAGTIGHIGVFSLNVHKHLQAGEGGVVVSDNHGLAEAVHDACNHGELAADRSGKTQKTLAGLNLRMTETTAAIACAQLGKAAKIINSRIALAHALTEMVRGIPWIIPPEEDIDCTHVYYVWAAIVSNGKRDKFLNELNKLGFPMRRGYSTPLHRIFDHTGPFPVIEQLEQESLITFEVCAYDPNKHHLSRMDDIIHRAAEAVS